jgi:hypothetical protein
VVRVLPTLDWQNEACPGVGLVDAVLAGDPDDARVAWLVNSAGEDRMEIVFPLRFIARFAPDLQIANAQGEVVLREGDRVDGGCVTGRPDGALLILWEGHGAEGGIRTHDRRFTNSRLSSRERPAAARTGRFTLIRSLAVTRG